MLFSENNEFVPTDPHQSVQVPPAFSILPLTASKILNYTLLFCDSYLVWWRIGVVIYRIEDFEIQERLFSERVKLIGILDSSAVGKK
jgi:hypothetical protein